MLKTIVSGCMFAVLALSIDAHAHTFDRRTFFTFSQPVTLPGVTLPAGTYQFRLADETTGRRVVQVMDAAGTESLAVLHSIPAERPDATPAPEIQFMETASGFPPAIQAWWNEGRTLGYEFIYPTEQARRLAGRSGTNHPAPIAARSHHAELIAADLAPAALDAGASAQ